MPEGDTVYRAGAAVRAVLQGAEVERVAGTHPAVRRHADRMIDRVVTTVRTYGKHLFVDFESNWTIRTHLGMSGSWHVYPMGRPWRRPRGGARVVLATGRHEAVCFAAPDVQVERTQIVDRAIDHLGPDLALPELDFARFLTLAATFGPGRTTAEVLVDQRVLAGAGNVYKSEVLFLERLVPRTPFHDLDRGDQVRIAERAHRLLQANLGHRIRSTTGSRVPGRELWVYGRAGRPCRRCGTPIRDEHLDERVTYWCPTCQIEPGGPPPGRDFRPLRTDPGEAYG